MAWGAFAVLAAVAAAGFVREGLTPADVWAPEGWRRFAVFTAGFALWTLAFWRRRRQWWLPATVLAAAAYGVSRVGVPAVLAPVVFLASCRLLGAAIAPRAGGLTSTVFGLAAWIFVLSLTIALPIHSRPLYAAAVALPIVLFRRRIRLPALPAVTPAAIPLVFLLLAHFLVALKPETGADALAVHLAVPETVAWEGRWAFDFERFAWALMPLGADWLYTAQFLLGGAAAARLFNFALLVLLALQIRALARRWTSDTQATLAAALFVSTPLVQLVTGSLFVENVWAVMAAGALTALLDGELLWAGALLGTGMAVKIGTAAFLPGLLRRRAGPALLLGAALAAPTYINAWLRSGNPVYPFLNHVFRSPSIDTEAPFEETRFREPLRWSTPYELTFQSGKYFEGGPGSMGFQYLLLVLPAALLLRRRPPAALFGLAAGAALLLYLNQPNLRYLYPALALLSAPLALFPCPWVLTAAMALNVAFLPAAGYYHREFALPDRAAEEAYIEIGFPQRKLIGWLNQNAPGEAAAFFGGNPIAGFHGRAYTDQWHSYGYWRRLDRWPSARRLHEEYARLGIRYVVAPKTGRTKYPAANNLLRPLMDSPVAVSGAMALYRLPEAVPPTPSAPAPPGGYDSPSDAIAFTGDWRHSADFQEALNGTVSFSDQEGSAAVFRFRGTGIAYRYTAAPNRGFASIRIDGQERARLNLYAPEPRWRQEWRLDGLPDGVHSIEIRVAGGGYVDIDQFTVTGPVSGN